MRTLILLLSTLVLLSNIAQGQVTLVYADIGPAIGDVYTVDSIPFVDMSTQTGANMTWNLSASTPFGTPYAVNVVSPSDTDNSALFPSATMAFSVTEEQDGMEISVDQYLSFDGTALQFWGTVASSSGFAINNIFSNPQMAFPIPMSYNAQGNDTYSSTTGGDFGGGNSSGTISWSTPGFGTLILNGMTYNNTIMFTFQRLDTTVTEFFGITSTVYLEDNSYAFFAPGYHYPIAFFSESISTGLGVPATTDYQGALLVDQTTVGLAEDAWKQDVQVFPNPLQGDAGVLNLFDLPAKGMLHILRTDGALVSHHNLGRGSNRVEVGNLSAGVYLLKIALAEGVMTRRLVVEE